MSWTRRTTCWSWAAAARACAQPSRRSTWAPTWPSSRRSIPSAATPARPKAASTRRSATRRTTIPRSTRSTRSRAPTTSATRTRSRSSATRRRATSTSSSSGAPSSRARRTGRSRSGRSAPPASRGRRTRPTSPGHVLLQVLYEQIMKRDLLVYDEWFAWKLVVDDGRCQGVICWDLVNGGLVTLKAKTVILCTGGAGPAVRRHDERVRLHGRRHGAGAARRRPAEGHGDDAVPPDDARADGRAHHRGLPRRGRLPPQLRERALPQGLRAERDGARLARRHLARRADRDRRGPRHRRQRPARPASPRRREDSRARCTGRASCR